MGTRGERLFWPVVAGLLLIMGTIQVVTARGETQIWDEGIHISAGYAYLKHGDYHWNREHPPLVKIASALALLPLHPKLPVVKEPWMANDQVQVGIDFLYKNHIPADLLLFRARSMTILLTLLGGLALAIWTRRRFGAAAALLALGFYAFDPNLIAHGRYVTTDVPMAVFFFLTCALWCDYLLSGRARDLVLAALAFGLALTVKFSGVLLVPIVVALYFLRWWQAPKQFGIARLLTSAGATLLVCVVVIGAVYGRETVATLRGDADATPEPRRPTWIGRAVAKSTRVLYLPRTYREGLNAVMEHNTGGHQAYLLGMRSDKGWWYYFPVVFAVKSTMAALALTLLLLASGAWRGVRALGRGWLARARAIPLPYVAMLLPAAVYFTLSMTSAINLGVRHILPVYPLLYVAAAALLARVAWKPAFRYAALALVALQAAECAGIYPDYLAFFNAASGGPGNGPHYLVDSNIDWGQDVKKLARWLNAHGTHRVWINYFGKAELKYYGIDEGSLPVASEKKAWDDIDGWAAVSATPLQGVYVAWEDLEPIRRRPVVAKVGYSIYIYDLRKNPR